MCVLDLPCLPIYQLPRSANSTYGNMNHINTSAAINPSCDAFPDAPSTLAETAWTCWTPVDTPELPHGGGNDHVSPMSYLQTGDPPSSLLWGFDTDAPTPNSNTASSDAAFLTTLYAPPSTPATLLPHQSSLPDPSIWSPNDFLTGSELSHSSAQDGETPLLDYYPTPTTPSPHLNHHPAHKHNELASETRQQQPKRRRGRPSKSLDDFFAGKGARRSSYQSRPKVGIPESLESNKYVDMTTAASIIPSLQRQTSISDPASTDPTAGSQKHRRNRAAALRYRHKIQVQQQSIEEEAEKLSSKHQSLKEHLDQLRNEVYLLHNELFKHSGCNCPLIHGYLSNRAHRLLATATAATQHRNGSIANEAHTEREDDGATPE